jgi:hypothetical protein
VKQTHALTHDKNDQGGSWQNKDLVDYYLIADFGLVGVTVNYY